MKNIALILLFVGLVLYSYQPLITNPIKITIKFSELQGIETNAIYEETLYENMTVKQKSDFDNLVDLINEII
ncbi:MAG: hypothetical protein ACOVK2_02030 [Candidatus Fonsibacter sp.]